MVNSSKLSHLTFIHQHVLELTTTFCKITPASNNIFDSHFHYILSIEVRANKGPLFLPWRNPPIMTDSMGSILTHIHVPPNIEKNAIWDKVFTEGSSLTNIYLPSNI